MKRKVRLVASLAGCMLIFDALLVADAAPPDRTALLSWIAAGMVIGGVSGAIAARTASRPRRATVGLLPVAAGAIAGQFLGDWLGLTQGAVFVSLTFSFLLGVAASRRAITFR